MKRFYNRLDEECKKEFRKHLHNLRSEITYIDYLMNTDLEDFTLCEKLRKLRECQKNLTYYADKFQKVDIKIKAESQNA